MSYVRRKPIGWRMLISRGQLRSCFTICRSHGCTLCDGHIILAVKGQDSTGIEACYVGCKRAAQGS
jgi:hypothetical protein